VNRVHRAVIREAAATPTPGGPSDRRSPLAAGGRASPPGNNSGRPVWPRMQIRRLTWLRNAFSWKRENLQAAVALHFAYYNFFRIHRSLRVTPAMEAGIRDHAWTIAHLLARKSGQPPKPCWVPASAKAKTALAGPQCHPA